MSKPSRREKLIAAGHDLFWQNGYSATGVREIVAAAGASPGSFTNHFASKEEFASEVLDRYFAYVCGLVDDALADHSLPPVQRLRRYLDAITGKLEAADWARGCMVGNFSLETSTSSEPLRQKLGDIFARWREPFAACIAEGQQAGEITAAFSAADLADVLLASWQGAMLRMKVERDPAPLDRFKTIVFPPPVRKGRAMIETSQATAGATRRDMPVLDSTMSYVEAGGRGPTVLLLHGNPTSSYIWRHIIPRIAPVARCIAPDLIGYGQSGKPDIAYRFVDQVRYLDAFIEALGLERVVILAQDWGTALAFHHAARRPQSMIGLAFMEFIQPFADWDSFHQRPQARELFRAFRTPGQGEALILEDNIFIERILPGSVLRDMTPEEMEAYRRPFPTPASRRPILSLPRELPIAGQPADVHAISRSDHAALRASTYPKLLFCGDPGALISPAQARDFAAQLPNCRLVELGPGAHYLQEDHPSAIGDAVRDWLVDIGAAQPAAAQAAEAACV